MLWDTFLTFNGDDVLPDLVLQPWLFHPLQQLINGVNVGVHRLEPMDLRPDGRRIRQLLLLLLIVHGGETPQTVLFPPDRLTTAEAGSERLSPSRVSQLARQLASSAGSHHYQFMFTPIKKASYSKQGLGAKAHLHGEESDRPATSHDPNVH